MPVLTDEAAVRLRFQLQDTALAPQDLVLECVADAEAELLPRLKEDVVLDPPNARLERAACLLAGAYVAAALASGTGAAIEEVQIAGQRISSGNRFQALQALAALSEKEAWRAAAPFLAARAPGQPAGATDSAEV